MAIKREVAAECRVEIAEGRDTGLIRMYAPSRWGRGAKIAKSRLLNAGSSGLRPKRALACLMTRSPPHDSGAFTSMAATTGSASSRSSMAGTGWRCCSSGGGEVRCARAEALEAGATAWCRATTAWCRATTGAAPVRSVGAASADASLPLAAVLCNQSN